MLNLFFPRLCNGCNNKLLDAEKVLCTDCRHQLPLVCHHRNDDPAMKNIFFGRIPLREATSLMYFTKKGMVQRILHNLKYRGQEDIGAFLGKWLGAELAECERYSSVDLVVPVPLHPVKQRKRGFNQVSRFGKEISKNLCVPFAEDILLKTGRSRSQTIFSRSGRFGRKRQYKLADDRSICGKHILLVDDIVTTGATIEQCAEILLQQKGVTLSVATMAIAS